MPEKTFMDYDWATLKLAKTTKWPGTDPFSGIGQEPNRVAYRPEGSEDIHVFSMVADRQRNHDPHATDVEWAGGLILEGRG